MHTPDTHEAFCANTRNTYSDAMAHCAVGDGTCDPGCRVPNCGYDGGDCDRQSISDVTGIDVGH